MPSIAWVLLQQHKTVSSFSVISSSQSEAVNALGEKKNMAFLKVRVVGWNIIVCTLLCCADMNCDVLYSINIIIPGLTNVF